MDKRIDAYLSADGKKIVPKEKAGQCISRIYRGDKLVKETIELNINSKN